ncbi:14822_t:CDS:2 [Entrophospora sp. SA101]|nr:13530_t:CDS:2 [Entrophospora sp. SA101]CAJ0642276.1 1127_t:CDS:2 [Entrophospora sp. SA101]CAJ0755553.1 14822_t:CDS:2 [Entrophospora sp. SA101]CAJ0822947.1 17053_t:CDS:2 [Entrophospora sp. SA101]CAJ0838663.1 20381_t:CDS:2 [Entrophospora sp. SA101]
MSAFVKDNTSKTTIYVGGLDDQVNEEILHAAFIPFDNQHRGFGFVEFEEADDAQAAIDNMNLSELYGKVIKVNLARPMKIREGSTRAVWSEDAWLQRYALKSTDPNVPYGSDEEDTHSNDGDNGLGSQDQLKSGKSNI